MQVTNFLKTPSCLSRAACVAFAIATVSCTNEGGNRQTEVTSVSVEPSTLELVVGETATLKANVQPINAPNKDVEWYSSGGSPGSVSLAKDAEGNCLVTALTIGRTDVYAKAKNDQYDYCNVRILPVYVTSIQIDKGFLNLPDPMGPACSSFSSDSFVATFFPSNADNMSFRVLANGYTDVPSTTECPSSNYYYCLAVHAKEWLDANNVKITIRRYSGSKALPSFICLRVNDTLSSSTYISTSLGIGESIPELTVNALETVVNRLAFCAPILHPFAETKDATWQRRTGGTTCPAGPKSCGAPRR